MEQANSNSGQAPIADNDSYIVQARDGKTFEFFITRGGVADERSGKFGKISGAYAKHADGTSSRFEWNEFSDHYQIASVSLSPEIRNSGIGLELYKHLANEALSKGKTLSSDSTISSEALKIYPRLAGLGYEIKYASDNNVAIYDANPDGIEKGFRPEGSKQFMGRDELPIATITGKQSNHPAINNGIPNYIKELASDKPPSPASNLQPPPLPPPREKQSYSSLKQQIPDDIQAPTAPSMGQRAMPKLIM